MVPNRGAFHFTKKPITLPNDQSLASEKGKIPTKKGPNATYAHGPE